MENKHTYIQDIDGVFMVMDKDNEPIAVQIDWKTHQESLEDFFDLLVLRERKKDSDTITLEELEESLKAEGKL